jgi:hypothetical protein
VQCERTCRYDLLCKACADTRLVHSAQGKLFNVRYVYICVCVCVFACVCARVRYVHLSKLSSIYYMRTMTARVQLKEERLLVNLKGLGTKTNCLALNDGRHKVSHTLSETGASLRGPESRNTKLRNLWCWEKLPGDDLRFGVCCSDLLSA